MKKIVIVSICVILTLVVSVPAMAQDYDLVINNGRVMDPETMYDDIANVGIKGNKIVAITKDKIEGRQTIDAKGLKQNRDGSYTIYFGLKAPKGYENNWVETIPGKSWFVVLRMYSPLKPWIDQTWRPSEIELVK